MSGPQAFLSEIIANPDDDTARLVYADWLEDNDDPERAEFIRAQVRLASMSSWEPERFDLEERALDLLADHRAEWLAHLPKWAREMRLTFRRGFVGEAEMSPAVFLERGDRLAELVPLEAVKLVGRAKRPAALAKLAAMNGVVELNLSETELTGADNAFFANFRSERLRKFSGAFPAIYSGWPGLARLTDLSFSENGHWDEGLHALLTSPQLGSLMGLDLGVCHLGRRALPALVGCPRLTGLRRLAVDLTREAPAGTLAAANWPVLEELALCGYSIRDPFADQPLFTAPWLANLRSLDLSNLGCPAGLAAVDVSRLVSLGFGPCESQDAQKFVDSPGLRGLTSLELTCREYGTGPALLGAILGSAHLTQLRSLSLCFYPTQIRPAQALAEHAGSARLRALGLRAFVLGSFGAAPLASSPHLRPVRLDLSDNDLGDRGTLELLRAGWLPSLRELRLRSNGIACDAARALAGCAGLSRLRLLDLADNPIDDRGATALADSPHLGRLLRLELSAQRLSVKTRERLRERFGGVLVLD
jgi:uncharacterized protein (TIGR02996 family)